MTTPARLAVAAAVGVLLAGGAIYYFGIRANRPSAGPVPVPPRPQRPRRARLPSRNRSRWTTPACRAGSSSITEARRPTARRPQEPTPVAGCGSSTPMGAACMSWPRDRPPARSARTSHLTARTLPSAPSTSHYPDRRVAIEGGEPELLTIDCSGQPSECMDSAPAYSSDGSRIAFVRSTEASSVLAMLDLCQAAARWKPSTPLASVIRRLAGRTVAGRQTINQIVCDVHRDDAQNKNVDANLFIVNADGSGLREFAVLDGTPVGDADWSPDGSRMQYSAPIRCATSMTSVPRCTPQLPTGPVF